MARVASDPDVAGVPDFHSIYACYILLLYSFMTLHNNDMFFQKFFALRFALRTVSVSSDLD